MSRFDRIIARILVIALCICFAAIPAVVSFYAGKMSVLRGISAEYLSYAEMVEVRCDGEPMLLVSTRND